MTLPLAGIRVLDLTTVAFGPYASQILGEQGAEIIKIEAPEGDSSRFTGPARHPGMAVMFLSLNRNKKSVTLDLKDPAARASLHDLVRTADVVMHNIRGQKLAKIGIDHETITGLKPDIVYAALKGFHDDGAYGGRPAYDDIIQGMSGVADLMERSTGEARYFPTIMADKMCGVFAAQAITAALFARATTGKGSLVEIPMFETMVSFLLVEHWYGRHLDPSPEGFGYPRTLAPWRRPYATADGRICFMPYNDGHWQRFWRERGRADMLADARFRTMADRTRHIGDLYELLQQELARETTAFWLDFADRHQIPAGPVLRLEDLDGDPHLASIGFFETVLHPSEGSLVMPAVPIRFDGSKAAIGHPPTLGQHNDEILA